MEINEEQRDCLRDVKRPDENHDLIIYLTAKETSEKLVEAGLDKEGLINQLTELFNNHYEKDGYGWVRQMEEDWSLDGDSKLVGIMDNVGWYESKAKRLVVKVWGEVNHIFPDLKVGNTVKFQTHGYWDTETNRSKWLTGVVIKADMNYFAYHIYCEEMGHVKEGKGVTGTMAVIKAFEVIEEFQNEYAKYVRESTGGATDQKVPGGEGVGEPIQNRQSPS